MTTPVHNVEYSYSDYLKLEAIGSTKHEYLAGQIYAMAGGTPEHAALATVVAALLFPQLRDGRCRVYDSDLRVRVKASGLATYPDVTVVCGPRELHPDDADAVTNPTLIVEVSSPSTARYDREDKFDHYKQIPSLQQYVLVSCPGRNVEVRTKTEDGRWTAREIRDGEVAALATIGAKLDVTELYDAAAEPS